MSQPLSSQLIDRLTGIAARQGVSLEELLTRFADAQDTATVADPKARFFDLVTNMCSLATLDGVYMAVNETFLQTLGYHTHDIVGQSFWDHIHPDDLEASRAAVRHLAHDHPVMGFCNRYRHADGSYRWLRWHSMASEGVIHAVAEDITYERQLETDLKNSLARIAEILQSITDAVFTLDSQWRFTYLNQQAERLLQRTSAELLGQNVWAMFPEAVGSSFQTHYEHAISTGESVHFRSYYAPLETWFDVRAYPSENGLTVFFLDIGEQMRQEESLRQREQEFRVMVESNPDLIVRFDRDLRYTYVNPMQLQVVRFPETYIGKTIYEIESHTPETVAWIEKHARHVIETGEAISTRYETTGQDGELVVFEGRMVPLLDTSGAVESVLAISRDVSDRARIERQLHESEARYRGIVENQIDLVCRYKPDTTLLYVNDAYCRFFDVTREKVIGHSYLPWVGDESRHTVMDRLEQLRRDPSPGVRVVSNISRNGKPRYVQWVDHGITDAAGNLIEIQAVGRDITELRRTQAELQRVNHQLRLIMDSSPEPILTQDVNGNVTYWNPACEHTFGWTAEEVLGRTVPYLEDENSMREAQSLIARIRQGERIERHEARRHRKNGQPIDLLLSIAPLYDYRGYFDGTVAVLSDITERKQAERELRQQKAILQTIIDNIPIMLALVAPDNTIVIHNAEFERVTGINRHTTPLATDGMVILYPDERLRAEVAEFVNEATGEWRTYTIRTVQGGQADVSWTNVRLADGSIISIGRDITERMVMERERERLIRDLEARNAEMERFTYTVSHDLKSPLITIRGFLGLLISDLANGDMERAQADIRFIHEAAQKMQELLEDLLELSRIGRLVNPPEWFSLKHAVYDTVNLLHGIIQESGVTLQIADDLPDVYGDEARLREVVQNLVENAIKFMGDQPAPLITIGAYVADGEHVVFVRDNGIGIDPRYHQKIFGLFEQLEQQVDGTGIGLALCRRIVELHGGHIWVESDGHSGSTFYFTLPLKHAPDTPATGF